jgi:phosphate-selective porin O/P
MSRRRVFIIILASSALAGASGAALAQSDTSKSNGQSAESQTITFTPGLRLQVRYAYDNVDGNNDFYIARTRIKGKGKVFGIADYLAEIKLDNVGRFARQVNAQVENAWLDFPLKPAFALRVGLYDAVFSRNALTSDSKLLLQDRSLIKDALTTIGLADNTVGLLVHGRPFKARTEYSVGVFDNLQFEETGSPTAKQANGAMLMGRIGVHLLDPAPARGYADYQSSYIGQGRRLSIGVNSAYLSKARAGDEFDISAWGADLFFNARAFTVEGEYDSFVEAKSVAPDVDGNGWYVQGGYLIHPLIELAARYQALDTDDNSGAFINTLRWTSVGFNTYLRGHGLKIQTDYTFKRERFNGNGNDALQVQLQMDF